MKKGFMLTIFVVLIFQMKGNSWLNLDELQAPLSMGENFDESMQKHSNYIPIQHIDAGEIRTRFILRQRISEQNEQSRIYQSEFWYDNNLSLSRKVDHTEYETEPFERAPSYAIHEDTGLPFYAYEVDYNNDGIFQIAFGWDNIQHIDGVGLITNVNSAPGIIWDNTVLAQNGFENPGFGKPELFIMDHPTDQNLNRIVVFGNNNAQNNVNPDLKMNNLIIATLDIEINPDSLRERSASYYNNEWEYRTITQLDEWAEAGFSASLKKPIIVDNNIHIFGQVFYDENEDEDFDYFILSSANNGITFTMDILELENEAIQNNDIPQDLLNPLQDRYDFHWRLIHSKNMNIVSMSDNHLIFAGIVALHYKTINEEGEEITSYFPEYQAVKSFEVNPNIHTIEMYDLWPVAPNAGPENILYKHWDDNNDGEFDTDENGEQTAKMYWPHLEWDETKIADINNIKIVPTPFRDGLFAVWTDGTKAKKFMDPEIADTDYESWNETPEICIAVSRNGNGKFWSEPVRLSSHDETELECFLREDGSKMIPTNAIPSDEIIVDDWEGSYTLTLSFTDDYCYGYQDASDVNAGGNDYLLSLTFSLLLEENTPTITHLSASNYPNPFHLNSNQRNNVTTIEFENPKDGKVEIDIFNIRGQKVKQILNTVQKKGTVYAQWNGTNQSGKKVSNGIYFYRIKAGNECISKRMMLIK